MSFNSKCLELARYFLDGVDKELPEDSPVVVYTAENIDRLAQVIQDAIEDEIDNLKNPKPSGPPMPEPSPTGTRQFVREPEP
jgi:hypothetical protein